jgi:hypothetical protein
VHTSRLWRININYQQATKTFFQSNNLTNQGLEQDMCLEEGSGFGSHTRLLHLLLLAIVIGLGIYRKYGFVKF